MPPHGPAGGGLSLVSSDVQGRSARTETVSKALGEHDDLLVVALDVTDTTAADADVRSAVERFGQLGVLVKNAGSFQAGFFEEMTSGAFRSQSDTTLFGPVDVTRAAPPQMGAQRSGLVITVSSTAGITAGGEFLTAHCSSKFGVEGFMEGLVPEIEPFGIRTTDSWCTYRPAEALRLDDSHPVGVRRRGQRVSSMGTPEGTAGGRRVPVTGSPIPDRQSGELAPQTHAEDIESAQGRASQPEKGSVQCRQIARPRHRHNLTQVLDR